MEDNSAKGMSFGTGFMCGMTAVKDCARTKSGDLQSAALLIGTALKDKEAFIEGFCQAILIALESENDIHANLQFIDAIRAL